MARLKRKISDKRLLYYIRQMLKAGVIDERGIRHEREEGTPQGGPLSPLLANVLLDDFDKELERRGHKFCRYADDCIIMVKTMAAAKRVLNSVTRYLENNLKLKVKREKSKIVSAAECPYLASQSLGRRKPRVQSQTAGFSIQHCECDVLQNAP
ncbi:MAG: hypothetical protein IKJ29_09355 [Akkermansia sp.]|nr:hypothetical protein [Akkermansia sp.]